MDLSKLNDWLQVLGLFGVLGGLIFVGMQLQLDRQVASSQQTGAALTQNTAWAQLVSDNGEVWVAGLAGEELPPVEAVQFETMAKAYLFSYFTSWTRAEDGLTGQIPTRFAIETAIQLDEHPGLLRVWKSQEDALDRVRDRLNIPAGRFSDAVEAELERIQVKN